MGADLTVRWRNSVTKDEILSTIKKASGESYVDAVIDFVGSNETVEQGLKFLGKVFPYF